MRLLDRTSRVPLYHQLYDILRDQIVQGEWQTGDMLPPEPELMERYQVSRTTVRQVLDMLVNDGLINRQQGRGTFVAPPALDQALVRIISFTEDMHQRGIEPGTEVLSSDIIPAPRDIAGKLGIEPGEELVHLKRLRLADREPMSIEDSFLVHSYCLGVLEGDYASNSLRQALEKNHGIRIVRANQVIRAIAAPRDLARLLSIRPNSALLFIERISYSQHNIPVEFLHIYYRGDRYTLYNELHD